MRDFICIGAMVCAAASALAQRALLRVTNPSAVSRKPEVLDLPLAGVKAHLRSDSDLVAVRVLDRDADLLTQLYASQIDGPQDRLLILLDLAPKQSVALEFRKIETPRHPASRVQARNVPERMDDFAWENDRVAYRVYGPALQATGEIASGIDVWSKRVPDFITRTWYARDQESAKTHHPELSYHRDNGQGLDSYEVGASRGCGGTAVWSDGKLIASKNFVAAHILADGPIRADFTLDYAPWKAGGATVRETKRITLDAGSHLNHMRSTFRFAGADTLTIAAGVAMHQGAVLHRRDLTIVSVWDTPQLASAGHIGTALLAGAAGAPRFAQVPSEAKTAGDALFLFDIHSGDTVDYFAGSAWSQGDTPTQNDFDVDLKNRRESIQHPLVVKWLRSR